jgi:hypothetical protein
MGVVRPSPPCGGFTERDTESYANGEPGARTAQCDAEHEPKGQTSCQAASKVVLLSTRMSSWDIRLRHGLLHTSAAGCAHYQGMRQRDGLQ